MRGMGYDPRSLMQRLTPGDERQEGEGGKPKLKAEPKICIIQNRRLRFMLRSTLVLASRQYAQTLRFNDRF